MRQFTLFLFLIIYAAGLAYGQTNPHHVYVKGYTRSNGTYVRGHYRTAPNSTKADNFSTRGNVNPYTGKPGWVAPDAPRSSTSRYHTATTTDRPPARHSPTTHRPPVGQRSDGRIYAVTRTVSRPTARQYAPLSSARPGGCTRADRPRLIDPRFIVQKTYLFNQPLARGQPMRELYYGDPVSVLCTEGPWYEVMHQGSTGWVEKRLVRQ